MRKEDLRNGWTKESLKKYHEEREKAQREKIANPPAVRPDEQVRYNPLKWRE